MNTTASREVVVFFCKRGHCYMIVMVLDYYRRILREETFIMREMRRQDRKVIDPQKIADVLNKARIMHLGLVDAGRPYIVPLNYGWTEKDGHYSVYAHSAGEGRKIDLIAPGADVCFEMECGIDYFDADTACGWGNRFQSVIGEGRATLLRTAEEKREGLRAIMAHYSKRTDLVFEDAMVDLVQVIRIDVDALSCKIHE